MQAIITKYLCPTNVRGSRYKASCERGYRIITANNALSAEENHRAACDALCEFFDAQDEKKYGSKRGEWSWSRPKASGQIPTGQHVFCFIPERVYRRAAK